MTYLGYNMKYLIHRRAYQNVLNQLFMMVYYFEFPIIICCSPCEIRYCCLELERGRAPAAQFGGQVGGRRLPALGGIALRPHLGRGVSSQNGVFQYETTYSNRKFYIIDHNKWVILYPIFYWPFYILGIQYYIINLSFYMPRTQY